MQLAVHYWKRMSRSAVWVWVSVTFCSQELFYSVIIILKTNVVSWREQSYSVIQVHQFFYWKPLRMVCQICFMHWMCKASVSDCSVKLLCFPFLPAWYLVDQIIKWLEFPFCFTIIQWCTMYGNVGSPWWCRAMLVCWGVCQTSQHKPSLPSSSVPGTQCADCLSPYGHRALCPRHCTVLVSVLSAWWYVPGTPMVNQQSSFVKAAVSLACVRSSVRSCECFSTTFWFMWRWIA